MTTATTIFALFAVMFATGTGSEVMKPIAAPIVGGMVTVTIANLILVPVLFCWMQERQERSSQ
jgi:Cu/Ag efflux pump CusA